MKVALVSPGNNPKCIVFLETEQSLEDMTTANPYWTYVDCDVIAAEIGDYYNAADGLFYVDTTFTHLSGYIPPVQVGDVLPGVMRILEVNCQSSCDTFTVPYNFESGSIWDRQVMEARAWTANNAYVPVMLNAMVAASSGDWTLAELSANIISNDDGWRESVGNILGQMKKKRSELAQLVRDVNAGIKDVTLITDFDTSFVMPAFVPVEKYM